MSLPVDISFANAPEGTCPATFDDLLILLNSLISGEITTTFTPYIMGSATPSVEDQDKAWIKLDAVGRPIGTYVFYSGAWRREYTGKPKEIAMFTGDPALYFDGTGLGLTTADWDGWAICNGANGTTNLTDRFLVAAHMDNASGQTGYVAGWRTLVSGTILQLGGVKEHLIVARDLPELDFQLDGHDYNSGGSPHVDPSPIVDLLYSNSPVRSVPGLIHYGFDSGSETQTAVPTLPPFYAYCLCQFVGYA